jgi:hypothetical protein
MIFSLISIERELVLQILLRKETLQLKTSQYLKSGI